MSDTIYKMQLHETIDIEPHHLSVTRVPGGWIYKFSSFMDNQGINISTCFVPYDTNPSSMEELLGTTDDD